MLAKIVFVGAGNLATHLATAFFNQGVEILQVYSYTEENAKLLADKVNAAHTASLQNVRTDADIYIYAIKDAFLDQVQVQINAPQAWHLHTAGSVPMNVFKETKLKYGVFYPLQTFSKTKQVDFSKIPICLEASCSEGLEILKELATRISADVREVSSAQREKLHLAAVFTCNFVNRMYAIAHDVVSEHGLSFDILLPLIDETAAKVHTLIPRDAQTGPAMRYDENVINKHLAMLNDDSYKQLYQLISENIYKSQ